MIHILPGAVLDAKQRRVIRNIEPETDRQGVTLTVTRGHSTPHEQLATIEKLARREGCLFSEFIPGDLYSRTKVMRDGRELDVYLWQQTLSALLMKGVFVNTPVVALCLEHYIRPGGEDMYLKTMHPSPHILSDPIDFSGRVDRGLATERVDLDLVAFILRSAKDAGAGIRHIKPEPKNVCVHIDLE